MKRIHFIGAIALAFGLSATAFAQDGTTIKDITVALGGDTAAAANDNSTAIGSYVDESFNLSIDDIAVAVSALDGYVGGNFNTDLSAVAVTTGSNDMHDGAMHSFDGIGVASQNTGNAALIQQSVVVQANVN